MNFRLIENEQLAMKVPYEVPFWERCYPEWNKGFVNIRMFVGIRNFMRELHCNRLIFRESELYDNLKPNLIQSLYANFQVSNIIMIKVRARFFNRFYALKLCSTACFVNQRLTGADAKTLQKSVSHVWWEWRKALPLHPQSREMRQ